MFYTVTQAAKYLGVTTRTVMNWIYNKKLTAYKTGGKWLIRKDDLEAFMIRN